MAISKDISSALSVAMPSQLWRSLRARGHGSPPKRLDKSPQYKCFGAKIALKIKLLRPYSYGAVVRVRRMQSRLAQNQIENTASRTMKHTPVLVFGLNLDVVYITNIAYTGAYGIDAVQ